MNVDIGGSIYCQSWAWSGEVIDILRGDEGEPLFALVQSHDPEDQKAWVCVPLIGLHSEMFDTRVN
jgi:hypothetical protein